MKQGQESAVALGDGVRVTTVGSEPLEPTDHFPSPSRARQIPDEGLAVWLQGIDQGSPIEKEAARLLRNESVAVEESSETEVPAALSTES
jgi:hypothetical protein